jgi:hypothetical protein
MNLHGRSINAAYLLFAILIVGAILRFIHINQPFVDFAGWRQCSNAMMAENFYRTNWNIFYPEISWHGPGPSYNGREFQTVTYIAAFFFKLFGQHEWIGRSIAVLFGLLGIFSLYQLVRRVWDNDRALMSAAVMAVMPGSIFIERSFMPDPAMVALVTTSFWMLIAYLQTDRISYLLLACLIGCLGFLTKLPGLIVGLPMVYSVAAYFIYQKKPFFKRSFHLAVVGVLVLVPVILYYLWARHLSQTYPPYHFAGSGNWLWDDGLTEWFHYKYFVPNLKWNLETWLWTTPIIILVIIGLIFPPGKAELVQKETSGPLAGYPVKLPWLFHWWFLAFGFYYLIGAKELVSNPWNFHILNPAAAALAGHALITIYFRWRSIVGKAMATIVLLGLFLSILWDGKKGIQYVSQPFAWPSYQLGLSLQKHSNPGDLVVTFGDPLGEPVANYYSQRRGWVFPPADSEYWCQLPDDDQISIRMFEDLRAQGADWLGIVVDRKEDIIQKHPMLFRYIDSTCLLKEKNTNCTVYKIKTPTEMMNSSAAKSAAVIHGR